MKNKSKLLFVPLGGCREIGKNLNMFGIIHENGEEEWILIDVGFSIDRKYGISILIPDYEFIIKKASKITGIIATHGHDDHIGALPIIIPELDREIRKTNPRHKSLPIYATKFTQGLIIRKFDEFKQYPNLVEVVADEIFNVGSFEAQLIYITHSIVEPNMVRVTSKAPGHKNFTLVHTGDWKLDSDPVLGQATDESKIAKLGDDGVDVLICDSTNAMEKKSTPPESLVRDNLDKVIKGNTGRRIVISCFSSNVARIKMVNDLAKKYNRKLVLFGKSLLKICDVAMETGYLPADFKFYSMDNLPKDFSQALVLCTGSQGEQGSVLHRLAFANRPPFQLQKGDLIIFSSRKIPGNEKEIAEMQNSLIDKGVTIIDSSICDIHVSGHPGRPDIERMIDLTRPRSFIPVHGHSINFYHMLNIAESKGIEKRLMPKNGAVIDLFSLEIIGNVNHGVIGLDGNQLVNMDSNLIYTRKLIGQNGVVFISVIPGQKPVICSYGVIQHFDESVSKDAPDGESIINVFLKEITEITMECIQNYNHNYRKQFINKIISEVNGYIRQKYAKNPLISVHILRQNSFAKNNYKNNNNNNKT